jgi:hypothetical protein
MFGNCDDTGTQWNTETLLLEDPSMKKDDASHVNVTDIKKRFDRITQENSTLSRLILDLPGT